MRGATCPTVAVLILSWAAAQVPSAGGRTDAFRDIAREAGIVFRHHSAPEKKYIVESMSGGVAIFDFDHDGLVDIYFLDSPTVETAKDAGSARSALYRNRGQMRFEDVTDKAGIGSPGWAMGVCTADEDGDSWDDVYVTALGGNHLYHNNRDGTFTDVTERAGVGGGGWSTGCGFSDYDRDGDLGWRRPSPPRRRRARPSPPRARRPSKRSSGIRPTASSPSRPTSRTRRCDHRG